jgi:hypothetical protein
VRVLWKRVLMGASVAVVLVATYFGRILYSQHTVAERFERALADLGGRFGGVTARDLASTTEPPGGGGWHLLLVEDAPGAWSPDRNAGTLTASKLRAWTPEEWSDVERTLAANEASLVHIEAALRAPTIEIPVDWNRGLDMTFPGLNAVDTAVDLLSLRAIVRAFRRGYVSGAIRDVRGVLRLSEAPSRLSLRTCPARFRVRGEAVALLRLVAAAPTFHAESAFRELDATLHRVGEDGSILGGLRAATAYGVCVVREWLAGNDFNPSFPTAESDRMTRKLARWTERSAAYEGGVHFLGLMQRAMEIESSVAMWKAQARFEALQEEYEKLVYPHLLSEIFRSVPANFGRERLRGLAAVRVARAGLSILAYRERTGRWPRSVAQALGTPVTDPFTGKPLKYVQTDEGAIVEAAVPMPQYIREDPWLRGDVEIVWRFRD